MSSIDKLIKLAENLTPSGEIGDGMVAEFHQLAERAKCDLHAQKEALKIAARSAAALTAYLE